MTELSIQRIDTSRTDAEEALRRLREQLSPRGDVVSDAGRQRTIDVFGEPLTPAQVVERICRDVQAKGLAAVLDYSARIDKAELTSRTLRVSPEELAAAHQIADASFLETVRRIRRNVLEFQQALLPADVCVSRDDGTVLRQRRVPLSRVGVCVPGGAAAYPSTLLMTVVPAQAAGVESIAVVAPPTPLGSYNRDVLATCHELGVDEVHRLGGAQAVAALAYGVEGIRRVDKIVGPGNLFVALAKRFVFGEVDIDSIAGPSEVVVLADDSARADFTAADLIAQAEHAPGASVLISWSKSLLDAVVIELDRQLNGLDRGDLARSCLEEFGALIQCRNADEAVAIADSVAPEHLHIAAEDAERLAARIPHAGAVFLGHFTPVALGDYVAGPSHVLPTGGTARFASGLSATDFVRSHSVIQYTAEGLRAVADDLRRMADKEGLSAHRASVDIRIEPDEV